VAGKQTGGRLCTALAPQREKVSGKAPWPYSSCCFTRAVLTAYAGLGLVAGFLQPGSISSISGYDLALFGIWMGDVT
jgi:hypothetical protein